MYLKRLTLQGFKSFGNKTELLFQPGITAIVGPNGSGKSNIGDAIRWVLGEQSVRSLRSARMDDVIFGGSELRKPLGLAEVTLTLDNSDRTLPLDYVEVTLTRRLFRSGESQYLINDTTCRLKDIHDLLADTGLGRDGYTLITQQDIETVLSVRPEDRRPLFEEAAGIVKYKLRKQEALRKLAETEQNLLRVGDILQELANQLGPLEEQAIKARTYRELQDQLRYWDTGLLSEEWREKEELLRHEKAGLEGRKVILAEKLALFSQKNAEIEELKFWLAQTDEQLEAHQKALLEILTSLEKAELGIRVWREKIQDWQEGLERLSLDLVERERELQQLGERWRARQAEESTLKEEQQALEEVYRRQQEQQQNLLAEQENLARTIEEQKNELIELLNRAGELRHRLKGIEENKVRDAQRRQDLLQREGILHQELDALSVRQAGFQDSLRQINCRIDGLRRLREERLAQKKELEEQLRQEEAQRQQLVASLEKTRSRQATLREMVEGHAGLFDGVRAVLSARDRGQLNGVLGVVADLIKVPRELEVAMEVALGSGLQNIVTTDEQASQRAIVFLKTNRAGRVTFLPLALLHPQRVPKDEIETLQKRYGRNFLGLAADLVSCEEQYRPAVDFLLGRTLVVTDLTIAIRLARETGLRYPVVTREGEIIRPGGAITGGHQSQQRPSLLAQRRELEELDEITQEIQARLEQNARRRGELLHRLEEIQRQEEALFQEERELELARVAQEKDLAGLAKEEEQLKAALKGLAQELAASNVQEEGWAQETARVQEELARLAAEEEVLSEAIGRGEEQLRKLKEAREVLEKELTETQVQLARLQQASSDLTQRLAEAEEAYQRAQASRDTVQRQMALLEQKIREAHLAVAQGEEQRKVLTAAVQERQAQLAALKQERQQKGSRLAVLEGEANTIRDEVEQIKEEVHALELRVSRLEMEQEQIRRRLWEEYTLKPEDLPPGFSSQERVEAIKQVESLKGKIKALGGVNLEAITEYENVKNRYDFLQKQYQDLQEAKRSLFSILNEIETTTCQRFREAFEAIQVEFGALFRRLFGGGRAELQLTDPANLGETGIEIFAQPPQKKTHHLLQLSTGEKTLTAIALLMAILKVKPAPFCVMDEVDAALDEANLLRFTELLKLFAEKTQFLVITHRRQTMEVADALYGVTMEESGVSKLVAVKLMEEETA